MIAAESQRGRRVTDKRVGQTLDQKYRPRQESARGRTRRIKEDLLASVPGVSPVVARTLIADMKCGIAETR
ncbi:MAG TPA: hypothetical protein VHR44_11020 [Beijerinckiaceae bacterium]|jgi:hypothetical protein|nr:hypothetical protein [Beijerinckiaceae bacterium]